MVLTALAGGLTEASRVAGWVPAKESGWKRIAARASPLILIIGLKTEGLCERWWVAKEGAKRPSSGQRVSAMQLFWLHSCHWPPGNAATTGSSSKAISELALTENWPGLQLLLLRDLGCPLGDSWEWPTTVPQSALLCGDSLGHFWKELRCVLEIAMPFLPPFPLAGNLRLSPKLLAGVLKIWQWTQGWARRGISHFCGWQLGGGKARQTICSWQEKEAVGSSPVLRV